MSLKPDLHFLAKLIGIILVDRVFRQIPGDERMRSFNDLHENRNTPGRGQVLIQ